MAKYDFLKIEPGTARQPKEYILKILFDAPFANENKNKQGQPFTSYNYTIEYEGQTYYFSASQTLHDKIQGQTQGNDRNAVISVMRTGEGTKTVWDVELLAAGEQAAGNGNAGSGNAGSGNAGSGNAGSGNATRPSQQSRPPKSFEDLIDSYFYIFDAVINRMAERGITDVEQIRATAGSLFIEANKSGVQIPFRESQTDSDSDEDVQDEARVEDESSADSVSTEVDASNNGERNANDIMGTANWQKMRKHLEQELSEDSISAMLRHLMGDESLSANNAGKKLTHAEARQVWKAFTKWKKDQNHELLFGIQEFKIAHEQGELPY